MRVSLSAIILLIALCCHCASARQTSQEDIQAHGRSLRFLGRLFGRDEKEEPKESTSSSSIVSSSSSSAVVSSGSASTSTTSTSISSEDPCGTASTMSSSTGSAQSYGSGTVSGVDCGAESVSEASTTGEETAIAAAETTAEKGKYAQAIAKSIGSGDGVDVLSIAIAEAVEEGEGDAIAVAVASSLRPTCKVSSLNPTCPSRFAPDAIVEAYALSQNSGSGTAYAEALAYGLIYEDSEVQSIFAKAVSKILKNEGCTVTKPLLADARAVAINLSKDVNFVKALDEDIKISQCLFKACAGARSVCCATTEDTCVCEKKRCRMDLLTAKPQKIWSSSSESCYCP